MDGWDFIVVADKKTPIEPYKHIKCDFLTCEWQEGNWKKLSDLIGWSSLERKTIGVLEAYTRGADIIAIVDDDNIPMPLWGKNIIVGRETMVLNFCSDEICFDPCFHTNHPELWHRGYPLELLQGRGNSQPSVVTMVPDVQTGLVNGDPDIDAVCRMEHHPVCTWDNFLLPITSNTFSPFNSQNTILSRRAAREYFMMGGTGRMTDIWASFYGEAMGMKVAYTEADVFQNRHIHDPLVDFEQEVLGHLKTAKLLEALKKDPENIRHFIPAKTYEALNEYKRLIKIIDDAEV